MNLNELAADLETQSKRVRCMAEELTIPQGDYSLSEALKRVRAIVGGERSLRISLEISDYGIPTGAPVVEWCVYDGSNNFTASDLAAAVNQCIAAHRSPAANPLQAAEAKLTENAMPF
jgi:hypothetical protein